MAVGALLGTRLQAQTSARLLTTVLGVFLLIGAAQMALKAAGVWFD